MDFDLNLIIIMITVGYFSFFIIFWTKFRERRTTFKKRFSLALLNGLETGSIETLEDVLNVYNGIGTSFYDAEESRHFAGKRLRAFLVDLLTGEFIDSKKDITPEKVKSWKKLITLWLSELKQEAPYSDLPQAERSVLQELDRLMDKKEIEGIKGRINDLAGMIQLRSEEHEKAKRINRWTVPLSIAGLILTLVSTAYGIYYSSKPIRIDDGQLKGLITLQTSTSETITNSEPNK